jgi:thiamine biosynthesis protein ThiS
VKPVTTPQREFVPERARRRARETLGTYTLGLAQDREMTIDTTLQIRLNGEPHNITAGTSVDALVSQLGLRSEVVAVELNERLVTRNLRLTTILREGDRIEIVTLVGGG